MKNIILIVVLFVLSLPMMSYGQDSTDTIDQSFKIMLDQKTISEDFRFDTLEIQINSPQASLKGFAFKIAVQTQFFTIEEIIPGDFFEECKWEFYNDKQVISDFSAENYLQVWEVIGLSEIFADSISPTCYSSETKKSIAKIIISKNQFSSQVDTIIPVFFLWEDCADNTISGMTGNDLFVSDKVFKFFDNQPEFFTNKFPTTQGIPANCTKPSALNKPVKGIEFINGGLLIEEVLLEDSTILNK